MFGTIRQPDALNKLNPTGTPGLGIANLLDLLINLLIVGAGIYALINFILAGYTFISAGGDPKKIESAWAKIWQSIIGLVVIAASFLIAAIVGLLIFGNASAILNPSIPTL
jgi:hypothetical protein